MIIILIKALLTQLLNNNILIKNPRIKIDHRISLGIKEYIGAKIIVISICRSLCVLYCILWAMINNNIAGMMPKTPQKRKSEEQDRKTELPNYSCTCYSMQILLVTLVATPNPEERSVWLEIGVRTRCWGIAKCLRLRRERKEGSPRNMRIRTISSSPRIASLSNSIEK